MPSKQELIAAERARRARKRAARLASTADPAAEAWGRLGVHGADTIAAIRDATWQLLEELPDADRHPSLREAVDTLPTAEFPALVHAALADLEPFRLLSNLIRLGEAGIPWLSEQGLTKALLLAAARPSAHEIGPLPAPLLDGAVPWRLYLAVLGHPVRLSVDEIRRELEQLPLALLDDLIDSGVLGRADQPWAQRSEPLEASYLRARLLPEEVSAEEAAALEWSEAIARHAYLSGAAQTGDAVLDMLISLYSGDRSHHFELRAVLPPEQRNLLQEIMAGTQIGNWPDSITSDRGLWSLLAAQWSASLDADKGRGRLINPTFSPFHTWYAYRAAYHRILDGDIDGALRQADAFTDFEPHDERAKIEITNLRAYLAMRPDEHRHEDLDRAERLLIGIAGDHPQARANLAIVQQRKAIRANDRESWENPYFVLGIPHESPEWTSRWRELSRQYRDDVKEQARVNDAWRRIQEAERTGETFFKLPSDDDFLQEHRTRSAALIPPLAPLPRRTVTGEDELDIIKRLAAPDLLTEFDSTLRGDQNR
ncbi:hypothetical protein [Actinomadura miaoliensis]|uniref:hypothetical protein n=1 Tax=Actinomadura miaoliensis TaxID=430685 RepID=UPI0031EA62A7